MARDEAPPFERGHTFFDGGTIPAADSGGLYGGENLEGKEYEFEDTVYNTGVRVRVRVVRNNSAVTIPPKTSVAFDTATPAFGTKIQGLTRTDAQYSAGIADELLVNPVPQNDLFYIVVRGPSAYLQDRAGGVNNPVNVGDPLIALTAVTTGATTAGRLYSALIADITASTTGSQLALANAIQNRVGRAMSAATTANTTTAQAAMIGW